MDSRVAQVQGVLLAAGGGSRIGGAKALLHDAAGRSLLVRAVQALRQGGCRGVTVVLGAEADRATALLAGVSVEVVVAQDWVEGQAASLRAGLSHPSLERAEAGVVLLVDLPDVGADVVCRVLAEGGSGPSALARAAYHGRPGHPVVLGRDHWPGVLASTAGDEGARPYLRAHPPRLVECGDLAGGADVDTGEARQRLRLSLGQPADPCSGP